MKIINDIREALGLNRAKKDAKNVTKETVKKQYFCLESTGPDSLVGNWFNFESMKLDGIKGIGLTKVGLNYMSWYLMDPEETTVIFDRNGYKIITLKTIDGYEYKFRVEIVA